MQWSIIGTGKASAAQNMAWDEELLSGLSGQNANPILHLYDWSGPSATYGHFIDPSKLLCMSSAEAHGLQLARRPTGGGLIFHMTDWAFSVLVPAGHPAFSVNTLENYAFVNKMVMEVVGKFSGKQAALSLLPAEEKAEGAVRHFCMAKPTRYDVMLNGRKVGGGAQRRTRSGFLHQGTISLALPDEAFLDKILLPGTCVSQAMRSNTCTLLDGKADAKQIAEARSMMADLFMTQVQITKGDR